MTDSQTDPVPVEPSDTEPTPPPAEPQNPLRRLAFGVVILTLLLFALSVLMERSTPRTAQAVVQGYIVPMAAEVSGRVIEVGVFDNTRVARGQLLFRRLPKPRRVSNRSAR